MTTVTFLTEGKRIIGFDAKGHSGYSEEGSDIVCAAVTSAVRLVESTVNDVLGLAASGSPAVCPPRTRTPVRLF